MFKNVIWSAVLLAVLLAPASCAPPISIHKYAQIFEAKPADSHTSLQDQQIKFENDTLRIIYYFWADRGVMGFTVFNKMKRPIYVDWRSSSLILNGQKLDYWTDAEYTSTATLYKTYTYRSPLILPTSSGVSAGSSTASSTSVRPERVAFIPPQSLTQQAQFYLFPFEPYYFSPNKPAEIETTTSGGLQKFAYIHRFSQEESPLKFRNYVTYKFQEGEGAVFTLDHAFYVSSITEVDTSNPLFTSYTNTSPASHFYKVIDESQSYKHAVDLNQRGKGW